MIYYTEEHEWLRLEGEIAVVGITDHAAGELGDIVFFEAREVGTTVAKGEPAAVVESVKAASDIFAPVSGEIVAANAALTDAPELINGAPEGDGWLFKLRLADPAELAALLDADAYRKLLG